MPKAAIFDVDGTLLDSVDLHAIAWHEAMVRFGHEVSFEQARSQIGKGGDKLIPVFLPEDEQKAGLQGSPPHASARVLVRLGQGARYRGSVGLSGAQEHPAYGALHRAIT